MRHITNKLKTFTLAITFFSVPLLFIQPPLCHAGDKKINIQGELRDSSNNLLDGGHNVIFRLYESADAAAPVWESGTTGITVSQGIFHTILQDGSPSLDTLSFNKPYYLGIEIGTEELTSRQVLGASALSLGSPGDFDIKNDLYVTDKVGIGTPNPGSLLELYKYIGDYDTEGCDLIFNPIQNAAIGPAPKAKISGQVTNGDANIGKISFYTANNTRTLIERMVIDEGNVGIGTTNPSSLLHIKGAAGVTNRAISLDIDYMNDGAENTIDFLDAGGVVGRMGVVRSVASPTSFDFFIGNLWQGSPQTTKSFYVQGGGNIGIGTTGPTGLLELYKNVGDYDTAGCDLIFNPIQNGAIGYAPKAKISGQVTNGDANIGKISFYTSNNVRTLVERMVINEGNVGIGISHPTERLYVAGNIYCTGQYLPSDIILKTGIETLPMDTLSRVMKLNGVKYKWDMAKIREKGWLKDRAKVIKKIKARGTTPEEQRAMKEKMLSDLKKQEQEWEKPQIGLIAQEIEAQFPELVKTYEDDSKAIDYAKFTAVLLEAVKAQQKTIESLKKRIENLENK